MQVLDFVWCCVVFSSAWNGCSFNELGWTFCRLDFVCFFFFVLFLFMKCFKFLLFF